MGEVSLCTVLELGRSVGFGMVARHVASGVLDLRRSPSGRLAEYDVVPPVQEGPAEEEDAIIEMLPSAPQSPVAMLAQGLKRKP